MNWSRHISFTFQLELNYQRLQREYEDLMRSKIKSDELNAQYQGALNGEIARLNTDGARLAEHNRILQGF